MLKLVDTAEYCNYYFNHATKMAPNNALKMAIFESGQTQWAIAERANIHETRLSKIVRGRLLPSKEERRALATALNKAVHDLFPESEAIAL